MIWSRKVFMAAAAIAAFAAGLSFNDGNVVKDGAFSEAQARIGRPLTPMSYAGVARRTTRRAVAVGAAGAAGPITDLPACRSWMPTVASRRAAEFVVRPG
jgi:hypothetical protein